MRGHRLVLSLLVVLSAAWGLYVLWRPVYGFNYQIYRYFAELSNSGADVFHLTKGSGPIAPEYLDFTPGDLVIYKLVFAVQRTVPRAWFLYQLIWGWLAIALAWIAAQRRQFTQGQLWALAGVLAISPAWLFLSALSGEDKLINAAMPLAISLLAPEFTVAAVVAGSLYAGISGFGLLYMPLLGIVCLQRWPGQWPRVALLGLVAAALIALTLLPFWPDNMVMFANRSHREAAPPFWYSIWMLAPGLFSPLLGKLITVAVVAYAMVALWLRRTSLLAAMLASGFTYFATTNFINHNRIAPMLFLPLLVLRRGAAWWVYAALAAIQLNVVLGYRLFHIPFPGPDALPWPLELKHVVLANMCLIAYLAMFFAGRTRPEAEPESPQLSASLQTR